MNGWINNPVRIAIVGMCLAVAGCASYYEPRYSDGGVYYSDPYSSQYRGDVYVVNPVYYPYWSVDYFYMSHYRTPYSFYHYPSTGIGFSYYSYYPGWYYGFRAPARFRLGLAFGAWYPWYGHGFYYHHYRPWYSVRHYHHHYHHYARPQVERRAAYRSPRRPERTSGEGYRNQLDLQQRQDLTERRRHRGGEREIVAMQRQSADRQAGSVRRGLQTRGTSRPARGQGDAARSSQSRSAGIRSRSGDPDGTRLRAPVREQRSEGRQATRPATREGARSTPRSTPERSDSTLPRQSTPRSSSPTRQAPQRSSTPSRDSSSAPARSSRSDSNRSSRGSSRSSRSSSPPRSRSSGPRSNRERDR